MKKITTLLAIALLATAATTQAQDWKSALTKAATAAADKATDGKLTAMALVGEWKYKGPGVKFEGNDLLSEVGGAALEGTIVKQLTKGYELAGIKPGACTFTFSDDKSFSAQLGAYKLTGTYDFDAATHAMTLHIAKSKINLASIPGHAYLSGTELSLVFPVTKLIELIESMGSKVESLRSISTMLEKYKNVYLGFAFTK